MNRITPRIAALGAAVAAVASAVGAAVQVTHEQSSESTVVGWAEHLGLAMFSLILIASVPVVLFIARRAGTRTPALVAAGAAVVLATLGVVSNIRGEDPSFFAAVAIPANLAILIGWTTVAVAGFRSRNVPRAIAIGLPLAQIVSIPLSQVGGGLIAAAYFVAAAVWALRVDRPAARVRGLEPAAA